MNIPPTLWHADDPTFPQALLEIPYPPSQLWTIGDRSVLDAPCVAIVGTRRMTAYGERVTRQLAMALARAGACVVSGMAVGIDATAHRSVFEIGGRTAAVLGTGVDVPYPVGHRRLHAAIGERGLLISEMSLGEGAHKGSFPNRNRLIAGLAKLTIVVEAGDKSGANITAAAAFAAHRDVAAVPGPIDAPQSAGTNRLIRDTAHILTCVNDALALMGLAQEPEQPPALTPEDQKLWDALGDERGAPVELLAARSGLPLREALAAVTSLELAGLIVYDAGGTIRRR